VSIRVFVLRSWILVEINFNSSVLRQSDKFGLRYRFKPVDQHKPRKKESEQDYFGEEQGPAGRKQ